MSVLLKCAACGHEAPFHDDKLETEAICPGCEVLLRRRSPSDLIAIPVSMELPPDFVPADLQQVPKPAGVLYNRALGSTVVRSVTPQGSVGDGSVLLARAVERLAIAIEKAGLNGKESEVRAIYDQLGKGAPSVAAVSAVPAVPVSTPVGETKSVTGPVPVLTGQPDDEGQVIPLYDDGRARPMNTPVLVRQEAAAEAHRFRRENQGATDEHANRPHPISEWIETHPVVMMVTGLALLLALVVMTTLLMSGWLTEGDGDTAERKAAIQSALIQSPSYAQAEDKARAFLSAKSLVEARPHIYQAKDIEPQLLSYYEPLANPEDYQLQFRSRENMGERAVYFFQVNSGKQALPLIVLQAGEAFQVFWQFTAGVGDVSWPDFLQKEPARPVLMRAFLQPSTHYDTEHLPEKWSSWLAQDWSGKHRAHVFCLRDSKHDRRLTGAYEEHSILRSKSRWIMAQVRLQHLKRRTGVGISNEETARVVEVPLGSWLPPEFVSGSTFYSEKDKMQKRDPLGIGTF